MNSFESKDFSGGKLFKKPEYVKPPASDKKKMQSSFSYEKEEIEDIVDLERESLIRVIEKLKKKARIINLTLIFRGTQGRILIKSGLISEIYFDEYQDLEAFIYLIQITEEDLIRYLPLYKKKKLEEDKILEHLESMIKYKPEDLILDEYDEKNNLENVDINDSDLNNFQNEESQIFDSVNDKPVNDKLVNDKLELKEKNEENILIELDQEIENILQSLEVENNPKKEQKKLEDKINEENKLSNMIDFELTFDKSMDIKNTGLVDKQLDSEGNINIKEQDIKKQDIEHQELIGEFGELDKVIKDDLKLELNIQNIQEPIESVIEKEIEKEGEKKDLKEIEIDNIKKEEIDIDFYESKENYEVDKNYEIQEEDILKENIKKEVIDQEVINQGAINQEVINQGTINQEVINQEIINQEAINKNNVVDEFNVVNIVDKEGNLKDLNFYEKQVVNKEDILEKKESIKDSKFNIIESKIEKDNYNRREERMIDLANLVSKIKSSIPTVEEVLLINTDTEEVEDSSSEVNEFMVSSLIAIYRDLQLFYTLINEDGNNIIIELSNSYLILQNLGPNLMLYSKVSKKANPSLIASMIYKILRK